MTETEIIEMHYTLMLAALNGIAETIATWPNRLGVSAEALIDEIAKMADDVRGIDLFNPNDPNRFARAEDLINETMR